MDTRVAPIQGAQEPNREVLCVVISAEGISFDYDGNLVLADVGLIAQSGQVVGLIGPNGSGNTTPRLRHTYRVTPRHGLSLRQGRWPHRLAVVSKACLIDHRGRIMSGPGSGRA